MSKTVESRTVFVFPIILNPTVYQNIFTWLPLKTYFHLESEKFQHIYLSFLVAIFEQEWEALPNLRRIAKLWVKYVFTDISTKRKAYVEVYTGYNTCL